MRHFVYKILFSVPRQVLHIIDDVILLLTLCYYSPNLFFKFRVTEHMKWAHNVSMKFEKKNPEKK